LSARETLPSKKERVLRAWTKLKLRKTLMGRGKDGTALRWGGERKKSREKICS